MEPICGPARISLLREYVSNLHCNYKYEPSFIMLLQLWYPDINSLLPDFSNCSCRNYVDLHSWQLRKPVFRYTSHRLYHLDNWPRWRLNRLHRRCKPPHLRSSHKLYQLRHYKSLTLWCCHDCRRTILGSILVLIGLTHWRKLPNLGDFSTRHAIDCWFD